MGGWAVIMTKPNCEQIAVHNLQRQGYQCYFPRFVDQNPPKAALIRPLFPRYLFVLINQVWYSIRGTRGVSYILLGENGPSIIQDSVIDSIKSKENDQGFIVISDNKIVERFSKGDKVKAIDGPLVGVDLIYQGMAPHERVKVLIDMLGRKVPAFIEEKILTTV